MTRGITEKRCPNLIFQPGLSATGLADRAVAAGVRLAVRMMLIVRGLVMIVVRRGLVMIFGFV